MADARTGLESVQSSFESREADGRLYWGPTVSPAGRTTTAPLVHILPNYDEHVVAYRDHIPSLHPDTREALRRRGAQPLAVHVIARQGLIVGGWRRTFERSQAVVTTQLLTALKPREMKALEQAAGAFGRFLEMPVVMRADLPPRL